MRAAATRRGANLDELRMNGHREPSPRDLRLGMSVRGRDLTRRVPGGLIYLSMAITIETAQDVDDWLPALADPTRRRIVEMLGESSRTASEIHRAFPIAAPAVSRHLRVLREAGMVVERGVPGDKRVRLYALAPEPLDELSRWLEQLSQAWQGQLDAFKDYVALRQEGPRGRSR